MRILILITLLLPLAQITHAEVDKAKLRALIRLPEIAFTANFGYAHNAGFLFDCGTPAAPRTPEAMQKELKGTEADAATYFEIGNLYKELKKSDEAHTAWEKSIALDRRALKTTPDDGARLARIAMALHQLEHKEDRDKAIAAAVEHASGRAVVWDARADIAMAEAMEALTGHIADVINSAGPPALEAALLQKPGASQIATAIRLLDQAKVYYDKAVTVEAGRSQPYAERTIFRAAYLFDTDVLKRYLNQNGVSVEEMSKAEANFTRSMLLPDVLHDLLKAAQLSHNDPFALGMAAFYILISDFTERNLSFDMGHDGNLNVLTETNKKIERELIARLEAMTHTADHDLAGHSALVLGFIQAIAITKEAAAATLQRAAEINRSDPRATELLLFVYFSAKNYPAMLKVMEEGIKHFDTVRWRIITARVAARQDNWERAANEVSTALKHEPDNFDANVAQCAILLRSARTDAEMSAVIEQFVRTQKLVPQSPSPDQRFSFNYAIALCYALNDNIPDARARLHDLEGAWDDDKNKSLKELQNLLSAP